MAARPAKRSDGLTVAQLNRALGNGTIAPVYLVTGDEDFLRRKAIDAIIAAVVSDVEPDMALERIDGAATPLSRILDAARSLPLFLAVEERPVRVVLVRDFDAGGAAEADLLEEYLENPVDATCLVLECRGLDARRKGAKLLAQHATKVACDPPQRESDVRRWIESSAAARGFEIDPQAVAYLLEMVGTDLQRLNQELDKAGLLAAGDARLTARQLESLLGRSREHSVFELTDALVEGRIDVAMTVLNRLLDDGEEPIRLLAMVCWVVRQLMSARDLFDRGCPEKELLSQLGGRWDQRRRVLDKARSSDATTLEELLVSCSRSDAAVKMQRGAGARGTLEGLCRRICAA